MNNSQSTYNAIKILELTVKGFKYVYAGMIFNEIGKVNGMEPFDYLKLCQKNKLVNYNNCNGEYTITPAGRTALRKMIKSTRG